MATQSKCFALENAIDVHGCNVLDFLNRGLAIFKIELNSKCILARAGRDQGAMRGYEKLKVRECLTQQPSDAVLPFRMQMNVQLVDQRDAMLSQWVVTSGRRQDQPPDQIPRQCQNASEYENPNARRTFSVPCLPGSPCS
jgi:hypothetical protein